MKLAYCLLITLITSLVQVTGSAYEAVAANAYTDEQICRAGLATKNEHSVSRLTTVKKSADVMLITYPRDDGILVSFACQLKNNEILWRNHDEAEWNKNFRLFFQISDKGKKLNISSVITIDSLSQSFLKTDF